MTASQVSGAIQYAYNKAIEGGAGVVSIDNSTINAGGNSIMEFNNEMQSVAIEGSLHVVKFSGDTISALKDALGYGDAIVKCGHCGQWGAVKTECRKCGAPVG